MSTLSFIAEAKGFQIQICYGISELTSLCFSTSSQCRLDENKVLQNDSISSDVLGKWKKRHSQTDIRRKKKWRHLQPTGCSTLKLFNVTAVRFVNHVES